MTELDILHMNQDNDHTDIFIVDNHDNNVQDFVTIDDTFVDLSDAVMIDMSEDGSYDTFSIDMTHDSDLFVTLDNDVIVSSFSDADFYSTIVDFDIIDDNPNV